MKNYASLDKVPIFNLLATPGISSSLVTATAVAYCERKRAFFIAGHPQSGQSRLGRQQHRQGFRPVHSAGPSPTAQHQRGGLLPVAADDRPGHRRCDPSAAERVRSRDLRADRQRAGSVAVPGWPAGRAQRHDRRGYERGDDRRPARSPERQGHQLPAAVPVHRPGGVGRADHRGRQHCLPAVEVRGGAAHGAVHRADPVRQPHLGGVRGATPRRCGTPSPRRSARSCSACSARAPSPAPRPSDAFLVQCDCDDDHPAGHRQRGGQHPGRLRPAGAGGVRRRPDRATRRPGRRARRPVDGHHLPRQPQSLRPVQGIPVPRLLRHQHDTCGRRQQGRGDQALTST